MKNGLRAPHMLAILAIAGLGATTVQAQEAGASPAATAAAEKGIEPYTPADVEFMQGMIHHHAQAIVMANWAPSHGARRDVQVLCERIVVGQGDEIASMQRWLRDRHQTVPDPKADMNMAGMAGMTLMPGMLTPEQMAQLDHARGPEFDRLFLTFMIQHHTGAITMVDKLFRAHGAGQDDRIFKFATDVQADQTTEIDRMHEMLEGQ